LNGDAIGRGDAMNIDYVTTDTALVNDIKALTISAIRGLNFQGLNVNRVNSVKALRRVTPSRATEGNGSVEGVTVSPVSPNDTLDQERATRKGRHDLSSTVPIPKRAEVRVKNRYDNIPDFVNITLLTVELCYN
jgi:hypothetical protein